MDPLERLNSELPAMTRAEAKVARFILDQPSAAVGTSLTRFAQDAGSSNTAVIRLCQKIGYDGYAEFKFSMTRYLLSCESRNEPNQADALQRLTSTYASYISLLPTSLDRARIQRLATAIRSAGRLVIWGANRSTESVMHLSNRLMRYGIFNRMTSDPLMMTDEANSLGSGDVCVLLTVDGSASPDYAAGMDTITRRGGEVFLVTMDRHGDLVPHATVSIELPWISRDQTTGLYEDQIIIFVFIEILLFELARMQD